MEAGKDVEIETMVQIFGQATDMMYETMGGQPPPFWPFFIPFNPGSLVRDWVRQYPAQADHIAHEVYSLLQACDQQGLLK